MAKSLNSYSPARQTRSTNPRQVKNNAGGYVYKVSDAERLNRFIIIGTTGGTYYQNERDLTESEADFVTDFVKSNWDTALEILRNAYPKAKKRQYALFTLASLYQNNPHGEYLMLEEIALGEKDNPKLLVTPTDVFTFFGFLKNLGSVGNSKVRVIRRWYEEQPEELLALRTLKYRQREGWTPLDPVRLAHPRISEEIWEIINDPMTATSEKAKEYATLKGMTEAADVIAYVNKNKESSIPWEFLSTEVLKNPEVWECLYRNGQLGDIALIRNLWRLLASSERITDSELIESIDNTSLHPMYYILAAGAIRNRFYRSGLDISRVITHLVKKFHKEMSKNAPILSSDEHKFFLGLDVSGSMTAPIADGGKYGLSCMDYGVALAHSFKESGHKVYQFSGIFSEMNLTDWLRDTERLYPFSVTDCSLPMIYATRNRIDVDTFVVFTDNETYSGGVHADEALRIYRKAMNKPNARLIVIAATATEFTIADPEDGGMFDVSGVGSDLFEVVNQLATV